MRSSFPSVLLPFSPTCCIKRTVHIRTVRFFVPGRTWGKASFLRLIIYPAVSFVSFLQEKKTPPFKKKRKRSPVEHKRSFPFKKNVPPHIRAGFCTGCAGFPRQNAGWGQRDCKAVSVDKFRNLCGETWKTMRKWQKAGVRAVDNHVDDVDIHKTVIFLYAYRVCRRHTIRQR